MKIVKAMVKDGDKWPPETGAATMMAKTIPKA